jgi:hypothetical protein
MSLLWQALEPGQPTQGVEEGSTGTALCKLRERLTGTMKL